MCNSSHKKTKSFQDGMLKLISKVTEIPPWCFRMSLVVNQIFLFLIMLTIQLTSKDGLQLSMANYIKNQIKLIRNIFSSYRKRNKKK
jgi:hypothetical protein